MAITKALRQQKTLSPPSALVVIGLAVFTLVVVTTRFAIAEVGIIVALIGLLLRPGDLRFPAPFWWAMGLVAWAFATAPFSLHPEIAQQVAIERLKVFVVFLVVVNTLRTGRYLRRYCLFILVCFLLFPVRGTIEDFIGGNTLFGRAIWRKLYENPNDLAAIFLLAFGLAISVVAIKQERARIRFGVAVLSLTMFVVILLTQSRGVFIGLVLGMGPASLGTVWKRPALVFGVVVLVGLGGVMMPDAVWTRLSGISKLTNTATIAQADPEGSAAQRWEINKTAFRIFKDHPVTGIGIGCYPWANRLYAPKLGLRDTHDTYMNLAVELGVPGLLLWLGMIASVLRRWRRANSAHAGDALPIQAAWIDRAVIGFLVAGFFGTYSGITMLYLMLGILWSAAILLEHTAAGQGSQMSPAVRAL